MKIHGLGIDIPDKQVDGRQQVLIDTLTQAQAVGFSVAELPIPGLNVIMNGELIRERVEAILEIIAPFDLRFSVHAPGRTNLAFGQDHDMDAGCWKRACVSLTRSAGGYWSIIADCKLWMPLAPGLRPCPARMNWRAGRSGRRLPCADWRQ